ncbi:MAG: hypothetical protein HOY75_12970 [Streptomyces sp.]|nr:hypothetical protein [Streptomyces sp.]
MSARAELRRYVHLLGDMWTPAKVTDKRVEDLYAIVRDEVLAEADLLPKSDVVAWLLKRAHEYPTAPGRQESVPDAIARLASKVDRGAVRPDNVSVTGGTILTIPVHAAPGFFQPGHIYARQHHGRTIEFHVRHVDSPPGSSYRIALGWRLNEDGNWEASDSDDLDGWTDITRPGAGR